MVEARNESWFADCFQKNSPGVMPGDHPARGIFTRHGLVDSRGRAGYRINFIGEKVFITDGPWRSDSGGVFPWSDEAELILGYLKDHLEEDRFSAVVDPACGCGHTPIAFGGSLHRFAFDKNPRSAEFVRINAKMNDCVATYGTRDIVQGFSEEQIRDFGKRPLFVINMPFALSPYVGALPSASEGGPDGLVLTRHALNACQRADRWTAVVLTYTLCDRDLSRWDILEEARRWCGSATLRWELLSDAPMWRINGKKEQPNPMPLGEGLPKKADCRLSVRNSDRERVRTCYQRLAARLEARGWYFLGQGILLVEQN
jgi:hypothetical protein